VLLILANLTIKSATKLQGLNLAFYQIIRVSLEKQQRVEINV